MLQARASLEICQCRRGLSPDDRSVFRGQSKRVYLQAPIVELGMNTGLACCRVVQCSRFFLCWNARVGLRADRQITKWHRLRTASLWNFSDWQIDGIGTNHDTTRCSLIGVSVWTMIFLESHVKLSLPNQRLAQRPEQPSSSQTTIG